MIRSFCYFYVSKMIVATCLLSDTVVLSGVHRSTVAHRAADFCCLSQGVIHSITNLVLAAFGSSKLGYFA